MLKPLVFHMEKDTRHDISIQSYAQFPTWMYTIRSIHNTGSCIQNDHTRHQGPLLTILIDFDGMDKY